MSKINPKLIDDVFDDSVLEALPLNDKIAKGVDRWKRNQNPKFIEKMQKQANLKKNNLDFSSKMQEIALSRDEKYYEKHQESMSLRSKSEWKQKHQNSMQSEKYKQKQSIVMSEKAARGADSGTFKGVIIGVHIETGNEIRLVGKKEIHEAGFRPTSVYACVNGKKETYLGYKWYREKNT